MAIGVDDSKRCGSYAGVDVGYWCKYYVYWCGWCYRCGLYVIGVAGGYRCESYGYRCGW